MAEGPNRKPEQALSSSAFFQEDPFSIREADNGARGAK
ncbi:hypothetical protein FHS01_004148 [Longimicrobium terrae]|uniref:Uncharacterized protein n=1 Tax=Longimicrobium terrae TaxID=1639882 RepID=A0A841H2Z3_9BACT|nr:hypothetical protein [Longimicrobium terrae]MBB6072461.1 hypothetical protein [Longimicrobium terrae]